MRARLVVFPIKGRNWCFSRSVDLSASGRNTGQSSAAATAPSTLSALWKSLSWNSKPMGANAELVANFVSNKMNTAWTGLEKAPEGSLKNKVHGVGVWLLSRVQPSENFLKSMPKDVTSVDITYPSSLNPRLVRRRIRHIALRGTKIHKTYFYGSLFLLPLTFAFTVLPLPNIPFFWVVFRIYSNRRALQGSKRLLYLVSDTSQLQNDAIKEANGDRDSSQGKKRITIHNWVLRPSSKLDELLRHSNAVDGLDESSIAQICEVFHLNLQEVIKYKKY